MGPTDGAEPVDEGGAVDAPRPAADGAHVLPDAVRGGDADVAVDGAPLPDVQQSDAGDRDPEDAQPVDDAVPDAPPPPPDLGPDAAVCGPLTCYASDERSAEVACEQVRFADCGPATWALCNCNAGGSVLLVPEATPGQGPLRRVTGVAPAGVVLSLAIDDRCLGPAGVQCRPNLPCTQVRRSVWDVPAGLSQGRHTLRLWSGQGGDCGANGRGFEEVVVE